MTDTYKIFRRTWLISGMDIGSEGGIDLVTPEVNFIEGIPELDDYLRIVAPNIPYLEYKSILKLCICDVDVRYGAHHQYINGCMSISKEIVDEFLKEKGYLKKGDVVMYTQGKLKYAPFDDEVI